MTSSVTSVGDMMPQSVVETSRTRGWRSVEVMKATLFDNELNVKDLTTHTIALNIGGPYRLAGVVDETTVGTIMHPGMLKVVPAGPQSRWSWKSDAPLEILHLSLSADTVRSILEETELPPTEILTRVGVFDRRIANLSQLLAVQLARTASDGRLVAESLAQELMVLLVRQFSSRGESLFVEPRGRLTQSEMSALDDFIEANLDQNISLGQLAEATGKSRFHFSRLFRRSAGTAPYQYVLERRIARALSLVRYGGLPLSDVAAATGFSDQSHFSRIFRKVYGATPGSIRAAR